MRSAVGHARAVGVAVAGVVALVSAGCGGGGAAPTPRPSTADKVLYATSAGQFGRDAYIYVGIDKGYFRAAGIDVTVRPGAGTDSALQLLSTGNVDFTPVDFAGTLIRLGSGTAPDVRAVAAIHQRTTACVLALDGRGIAAVKDLAGHSVGTPTGSTIATLFPAYAARAGLDARAVRLVNLPPEQLPDALTAGTVDALGQTVLDQPTAERTGTRTVVLPFDDYLADLYGDVLVTSARLARQKPDLVRRFTAALLLSLQYAIDHPAEASRILRAHGSPEDAKLATEELTLLKPYVQPTATGTRIGTFDRQRVARGIALLESADAIPSGLTPDRVVDFSVTP